MINQLIKPTIAISLTTILTGCLSPSYSTSPTEFTNLIKDNNITKERKELKKAYLKKEKHYKIKNISFRNQKSIIKTLEELSNITGKTYIITKGQDFQIPAYIGRGENITVKTIGDINRYIEPTTGKYIKCVKNCFLKSGIAHIEILDKREQNSDLADIKISISKNQSLKNIIDEIKANQEFQQSGFSISYSPFLFENPSIQQPNNSNPLEKKQYAYLTEVSLPTLFNIISSRDNIIIDIDYDMKKITLKKRARRNFNLTINNLDISADTNVDTLGTTGESSGSASQIGTKIKVSIMTEIEQIIKNIIKNDNNKQSSYTAIPSTGSFIVFATHNALEQIQVIIDEKNKEFNRSVDFELVFLEVALKKDYLLGTNMNYQKLNPNNGIDSISTYDITTIPSYALKKTISKEGLTSSFFLDAQNSIAKTTSTQTISATQRNFIPFELTRFNTKDYVKKQKVTTTSTTSTTTNSEEEIGTSKTGYSLILMPHIVGNRVSLHITPSFLKNLGYSTNKDETLSLPEDEKYTYKQNILFYDGEEKIISSETKLEEAKNYSGMFPVEDFIIGGKDGKKYIQIAQLVFLKVKLN